MIHQPLQAPRPRTRGISRPSLAARCGRAPGRVPLALPLIAGVALLALAAPSADAQAPERLHLYAASDFGIDPASVTFTKDIAPILQRSCENCHRPGGGGPMSL